MAGEAASCPESSETNVSRAQGLQAWGRFGMRQIWHEAFPPVLLLSKTGAVSCWLTQTRPPSQAHAGCTTSLGHGTGVVHL